MSTPRRPRTHQAGFTLVELMVVVMIIGFAVSMVSLTVGRDDQASRVEEAIEQFVLEANFVSEQSVLDRELIGLFWSPQSVADSVGERWCYQWHRQWREEWQPLEGALEGQCLPEDMQVELQVEGERWRYDSDRDPQPPVLVFAPSGEATEFEMALMPAQFEAGEVQRVQVSPLGEVTWKNREEEESWSSEP